MATLPNVDAAESEVTGLAAVASRNFANYEKLVARVSDAFGDELKASRWLSLPNPALNGESPLQFAMRDGYELRGIEPILARMEHGIYL